MSHVIESALLTGSTLAIGGFGERILKGENLNILNTQIVKVRRRLTDRASKSMSDHTANPKSCPHRGWWHH